jgi:hypothetical protein
MNFLALEIQVVSLLVVHGKMEGTVWEAQEEDYPWINSN